MDRVLRYDAPVVVSGNLRVMASRGCGGLLLMCAALTGGCGSGASHPAHPPDSAAVSRSASTSASARAASENGKSPKQIVADASAALRNAHGFEMQGSIVQGRLRITLNLISAPSSLTDLGLTLGSTSAELIHARGGDFIRANGAFWAQHVGVRAASLAGRWIEIPTTSGRSFTASLGSLAPNVLARCLAEDHGTLSVAGKLNVENRRATVIKDAGDTPGSSPSVLTVAADGRPYPLTYTATRGARPGGRIDVCNQGKGDTAHGMITFNHFGHVSPITAPANPLRLSQPPSI